MMSLGYAARKLQGTLSKKTPSAEELKEYTRGLSVGIRAFRPSKILVESVYIGLLEHAKSVMPESMEEAISMRINNARRYCEGLPPQSPMERQLNFKT